MATYHGVKCKLCGKDIPLGIYEPFSAGDKLVQFVSIPGAQMQVCCPECEHAAAYQNHDLVQFEEALR